MMNSTAWGAALFAMAAALPCSARAEWFGGVGLTSDHIERAISQSDERASFDAHLGWRHRAGAYAILGVATVSDQQFTGSDGYKLTPEIGWALHALGADKHGRAALSLRGQLFPGARGAWFSTLPPRLQAQAAQLTESDYGTLEANASIGWKAVTLSFSHSLTDYLGLSARTAAGQRVVDSKGTTYLALDVDLPVGDSLTLSAGAGRLRVPNFDGFSYTDWRIGASLRAGSLDWGLRATGSNADPLRWRARDGESTSGSTRLAASVGWSF
jgi:hypothetical protein